HGTKALHTQRGEGRVIKGLGLGQIVGADTDVVKYCHGRVPCVGCRFWIGRGYELATGARIIGEPGANSESGRGNGVLGSAVPLTYSRRKNQSQRRSPRGSQRRPGGNTIMPRSLN